ncbi:hypothetical protein [Pseudarthrobacter sp. TAF60_1]|uniref:hypothetical protein n=1 Tax=Pseudarthrobacter sp. TAF60_1 TaxID=3233071 RepID=UPI003F9D05B9
MTTFSESTSMDTVILRINQVNAAIPRTMVIPGTRIFPAAAETMTTMQDATTIPQMIRFGLDASRASDTTM